MLKARPPRRSPLHGRLAATRAVVHEEDGWLLYAVFSTTAAETALAREGVVVADESSNGRLEVKGTGAAEALRLACGFTDMAVGEGAAQRSVRAYRLAEDIYLVGTLRGGEAAVLEALAEAGVDCRVRDLTEAWAEIRLIGPASRGVLACVCALDLDPAVFPDRCVQRGWVLHCEQVIMRRDLGPLPGFSLLGPRSSGVYLWDGLLRVGARWGATPIGLESLRELKIVSQIYQEMG
jgi:sarcosine oxidase, subunit alpha